MPKIDTGRANVARAWNYMVGGKDNFEVDREAARQLMEVAPVIRIAAPASRAVVPGSYLAIMHPASDLDPALLEAGQRWNQLAAQPVRLRSRADMTRFLAGLELVEPGLVTVPEWRPDASARPAQIIPLYGVVARKP